MSYTPTEWESTDVVTAIRMNALEQAVGDMNMSYTPNTWSDGDILSAEKMNALEQAVASGGGGSSDFSTAEVTVVNSTAQPLNPITFPQCLEENDLGPGSPAMIYGYIEGITPSSTETIKAPLYKGRLYLTNIGATDVSGDATLIDGDVLVTGDCTITI